MSAETLPPPPDSLFYKVRFTPLRDILRGKLTARLDLARIIDNAGLPPELSDIVRTTIKRTRLRWGEKADVARELVAHFQDGIESGASATDLAATFGDIRVVAALIRRARKRQRNVFYRALVRTLQYGTVLLIAIYLLLTLRYYSGEIKVRRNFMQEFNATTLATRPEDRAWPIYRRAYLSTTRRPNDEGICGECPSCPGWDKLNAYLESNADAVRLFREGAAKPVLGVLLSGKADDEVILHNQDDDRARLAIRPPQHDENPLFIGLDPPHPWALRMGARLLRLDAAVAAAQGDAKRFIEDVNAILAMTDHCAERASVTSDLIAIDMLRQAEKAIGRVLGSKPELLTDAQWVQLAHRLSNTLGGGTIRLRLDGERANIEDIIQRYYTDDGAGDGHLQGDFTAVIGEQFRPAVMKIAGPAVSALAAPRRDLAGKLAQIMAWSELEASTPLWKRDRSDADREMQRLQASPIEQARFLWLTIVMPSFSRANASMELATQQRDATLVAIALELYRRLHGAYPPTLEALVPQFQPTVPPDRFDGKPLKYKLENGKPLLYSVGVNRVDDGGILPKGQRRTTANWNASSWVPPGELPKPGPEYDRINGDWILWPPVED